MQSRTWYGFMNPPSYPVKSIFTKIGFLKFGWGTKCNVPGKINSRFDRALSYSHYPLTKHPSVGLFSTYSIILFTIVLSLLQVERYVDRKLDKAETILKKKERKAKIWFNKITNNEDDIVFHEIHVFLASFIAGIAMGIISGKII